MRRETNCFKRNGMRKLAAGLIGIAVFCSCHIASHRSAIVSYPDTSPWSGPLVECPHVFELGEYEIVLTDGNLNTVASGTLSFALGFSLAKRTLTERKPPILIGTWQTGRARTPVASVW